MADDAALHGFLVAHFQIDGLKRFVHTVDQGLGASVTWTGSLDAVAFDLVLRLRNRGLMDDALRDKLIEARPNAKAQIRAVFAGTAATGAEAFGAERRAAYTALWPKLRPTSTFDRVRLDADQRRALITALTDWYFDGVHGLYISELAQMAYRLLLHALADPEVEDDVVRTRASWLRSMIVSDLGTRTSTPPPTPAPASADEEEQVVDRASVVQQVLDHAARLPDDYVDAEEEAAEPGEEEY